MQLMFYALWQIHKRGADAHWRRFATLQETNGNIGDTEEVMYLIVYWASSHITTMQQAVMICLEFGI